MPPAFWMSTLTAPPTSPPSAVARSAALMPAASGPVETVAALLAGGAPGPTEPPVSVNEVVETLPRKLLAPPAVAARYTL